MLFPFSDDRITLAELKSLVEKMQNLPCVIKHLKEVQVRNMSNNVAVNHVSSWRPDGQKWPNMGCLCGPPDSTGTHKKNL